MLVIVVVVLESVAYSVGVVYGDAFVCELVVYGTPIGQNTDALASMGP